MTCFCDDDYTIKALGPGFCKGIFHYTEVPETFLI